jgi:hypothetical protein
MLVARWLALFMVISTWFGSIGSFEFFHELN